jgi:hypothetical protein
MVRMKVAQNKEAMEAGPAEDWRAGERCRHVRVGCGDGTDYASQKKHRSLVV